jgi:hypothetical protein
MGVREKETKGGTGTNETKPISLEKVAVNG